MANDNVNNAVLKENIRTMKKDIKKAKSGGFTVFQMPIKTPTAPAVPKVAPAPILPPQSQPAPKPQQPIIQPQQKAPEIKPQPVLPPQPKPQAPKMPPPPKVEEAKPVMQPEPKLEAKPTPAPTPVKKVTIQEPIAKQETMKKEPPVMPKAEPKVQTNNEQVQRKKFMEDVEQWANSSENQ